MIWVRSWKCSYLVTWFSYQLIAKPGNKIAALSWPDPHIYIHIYSFLNFFCIYEFVFKFLIKLDLSDRGSFSVGFSATSPTSMSVGLSLAGQSSTVGILPIIRQSENLYNLKSLATWPFFKQFVQANNWENIKSPYQFYPPVICVFSSHRANNAESISMLRQHHVTAELYL